MDLQRTIDVLRREPERIERPLIVVAIVLVLVACAVYATPAQTQNFTQPRSERNAVG